MYKRTSCKVKSSKVKVTMRINVEKSVSCIPNCKAYEFNFKLGTQMKHGDPYHRQAP